MNIVDFASSVDPDEAAPDEPPHLDLYCLSSRLGIFHITYSLDETVFCFFLIFADVNFVICLAP